MWDIITESVAGRAITWLTPSLMPLPPFNSTLQAENDDRSDITKTNVADTSQLLPMNWSLGKKHFVLAQICLLTFSVYAGSAIYTPGLEMVSEEFGVVSVVSTLGLTLFVIGYSLGPVLWTIFSEDVKIGRSPVLVGTLFVFALLQVGCARVQNLAGLLVMRFLAGVFGSPALAIPANMIFDMYPPTQMAYAIVVWGCSAAAGPTMGPLISGYAVMAEGWRWSFWILLWMSCLSLLLLVFFLPETLPSNIKLRRGELGSDQIEKLERTNTAQKAEANNIGKTILQLSFTEVISASLNMYIALLYGILYIWFESFPIVYLEMYHFNIGEMGLAFIGLATGVLIGLAGYCVYIAKFVNPRIIKYGGIHPVELRLLPAFITSFCIPICLFMFGWSAGRTHWIVPTIATGFFGLGVLLAFQSVIIYLADAYGKNAPAAMAANALIRGAFGSCFPLFGRALFVKLGVDWGNSLLGFISVLFFPIPFLLYRYGRALRARSPLASEVLPSDAVQPKSESASV